MQKNQAIARGLVALLGASQLCLLATAKAQTPAATTSSDGMTGLEEIVVTAQKRSENLQDVPIAISSVTAARLESAGVADTRDLSTVVPALNVAATAGRALPNLRGVGASVVGPGFENPVAFYVDGVYMADPSSALLTFNTVSQIDVLKGPQGTLFGRNATGGVIQVTTQNPSEQFGVKISASASNYRTGGSKAYITTGLARNLAVDLAMQYSTQGEGYGTNLGTGKDVNQTRHDAAARTKLRYANDSGTEAVFAADYVDLLTTQNVAIREIDGEKTLVGGLQFPGHTWDLYSDRDPQLTLRGGGASINLAQDAGPVRIVSITSARRLQHHLQFDGDLTPAPALFFDVSDLESQFTQELQLLSNSPGRFQWVTGAYAYTSSGKYQPFNGAGTLRWTSTTAHSYAAFGEAKFNLTDATRLTLGARDTREKRELHGYFTNTTGTPTAVFPSESLEKTKPTWRLGLDQKLGDSLIYASYNRGFKSGGFNASTPADPAYEAEQLDAYEVGFKSQLGQRIRFNGAAYYYDYANYQIAIFQAGANQVINADVRIYGADAELEAVLANNLLLNLGASYSHARFSSFPNASFYTPQSIGGNSQIHGDAKGNHVPYAPDATGNVGLDYSRQALGGKVTLNANYYYNGGWYPEADNRIKQKAYGLVSSSAGWSTTNDGFWVRLWGKNLSNEGIASQVASNVLATNISYLPPRTYGLEIGAKFSAGM